MATDAVGEAPQCQEDLFWRKALTGPLETKRRRIDDSSYVGGQWSYWISTSSFLTSVVSKSKMFQNISVSSSSSWFGMSKPNQKRPLQVPLWALESREPMWGTALDVHRSWGRGNGWCYSQERVDHLRKENSPGPGWSEAVAWMPKLALMEAVLHHLGRFEVDDKKLTDYPTQQ